MEINKILTADVLDIIFDGRNKEYGAYELRKSYDRRLLTALKIMGFLLAATTIIFITQTDNRNLQETIIHSDATLESYPPVTEPPVKLPPPPVAHTPRPVATRAST